LGQNIFLKSKRDEKFMVSEACLRRIFLNASRRGGAPRGVKGKALSQNDMPTSRLRSLGGASEEAQGRVEGDWRAGALAPPLSPDKGGKGIQELSSREKLHYQDYTYKVPHFFYLARCADGSLYAGTCVNVSERETKHNAGTGAKYTRSRRPIAIIHCEEFPTLSAARRREAEVKKWPKERKESLLKRRAHHSHA
jgi:putative endonuclease